MICMFLLKLMGTHAHMHTQANKKLQGCSPELGDWCLPHGMLCLSAFGHASDCMVTGDGVGVSDTEVSGASN